MAAQSKASRLSSIGAKIALLPIFGLLAILFIQGIQFYVESKAEEALINERNGAAIANEAYRLLLLEHEFMNSVDDQVLARIEKQADKIERLMDESRAAALSPEVSRLLGSVQKAFTDHFQDFKDSISLIQGVKSDYAALSEHFHVSDSLLLGAIEAITQEETTLIMSGESLPDNLIALRDTLKEYMGYSSAAMLNMADLLAFSDAEAYEAAQAELGEKIAMTAKNLEGMIVASDKKDMVEMWDKVKAEQATIAQIQGRLYQEWTEKQARVGEIAQGAELIQSSVQAMSERIETELKSIQQRGALLSLGALLGAFLVLVLLSWAIVRRVTRPVRLMTEAVERMADGDFTVSVDHESKDETGQMAEAMRRMIRSQVDRAELAQAIAAGDLRRNVEMASDKDALGRALRDMVIGLNDILGAVNQAVNQVSSGAGQMSDSSQALSQGATEQAASLEEITSSMTELGSQTKNNAENATQANHIALAARESAEKGNSQMSDMVAAMQDIGDSSKEIAKIIKAIDDIAFQTNLLALNAAVEAARAGKHGKGFAVVAQEVRNLAGRSAKAARETAELIEGSVKKVENGAEILNQTALSLAEIVEGSTKVTDLVAEIAASSNEQAQGISQVNVGLGQVEQVTQQTTANAEETAAAAVQLSSQAEELGRLLSRFRLMDSASGPQTRNLAWPESDGEDFSDWPEAEESRDRTTGASPRLGPADRIELDDPEFGKY